MKRKFTVNGYGANTSNNVEGTSVNYGGAFDVEPEQFFTREEINELGYAVCEKLREIFNTDFSINEIYMDDSGKNILTIDVEALSTQESFDTSMKIDLRRIRCPRDIMKYANIIASVLENIINQSSYELSSGVEASTDVVASDSYSDIGPDAAINRYGFDDNSDDIVPEHDIEETVHLNLDAVIDMDDDGNWVYEDTTYPWARESENEKDIYSDTYPNHMLSDLSGTVEKVDDLLVTVIPMTSGRFKITGKVDLVFEISGVETNKKTHETYLDNVSSRFILSKSSVKDFKMTELRYNEN